jgi:hypothetical protein
MEEQDKTLLAAAEVRARTRWHWRRPRALAVRAAAAGGLWCRRSRAERQSRRGGSALGFSASAFDLPRLAFLGPRRPTRCPPGSTPSDPAQPNPSDPTRTNRLHPPNPADPSTRPNLYSQEAKRSEALWKREARAQRQAAEKAGADETQRRIKLMQVEGVVWSAGFGVPGLRAGPGAGPGAGAGAGLHDRSATGRGGRNEAAGVPPFPCVPSLQGRFSLRVRRQGRARWEAGLPPASFPPRPNGAPEGFKPTPLKL